MAWYAKFDGIDGSYKSDKPDAKADGDSFVFEPQSTSEQTALQPYMEFKLKEVLISGVIQNGDGDDGFTGGLAVDPTNPNSEVDGRDFLIWQRGNATPGPDDNVDDGLLLPAVQTDEKSHLEWPIGPIPEVQDDGLLLPAVQGLLLPAVQHDFDLT